MNPSHNIDQADKNFKSAVAHFQEELKKLRTGRAFPGMLDGVMVTAYGTNMPLIQVGSISVPEPQLLQITPFDPSNIQAISSAIRDNQSLGLNPMDDGRVVRVPVPPLTEERRREYVKVLGGKVEDCMVRMRQARHDAMRELDDAKKNKNIGEDEHTRVSKQIDELMSKHKTEVESLAKTKENEIMTV